MMYATMYTIQSTLYILLHEGHVTLYTLGMWEWPGLVCIVISDCVVTYCSRFGHKVEVVDSLNKLSVLNSNA